MMILFPAGMAGLSWGSVRGAGPPGAGPAGASKSGSGAVYDVEPSFGPTKVPAEAIMYRVVTDKVPPCTKGTEKSRSYCGYGAVGTLTGRCGVSSKPETAIQPTPAPVLNFRQPGSFERISHKAV